ncbi:MAG TPA: hypothetical protein VJ583_07975 [Nitrososphaeraceae archaeon]|nr:hypothetical protein [Nitrososphaeraceae archaeon]
MLNFNTNTLKKETSLPYLRSNILGLSFLLLLIAFYPQNLSAFFHTNQMNNPLYGNFGSSVTSLYSNPGSLYGSNFGSIYGGGGGGISGLGMNNGFGMMMPGYGYGTPSFGSGGLLDVLSGLLGLGSSMFGGGIGGLGMNNGFGMMMPGYGYGIPSFGSGGLGGGGMLDVISGILGGLGSSSNQGFGSNYNFDYGYESNYNNNLDYTLQPNDDDFDSFGYNSNYGSNSDFDYGSNEFQSDLPIEDLRSFDSSMEEQQQYSFQDDYDFSQTPLDDFSSNLFQ